MRHKATTDILGIIGHMSPMNKEGQTVIVYVNHLDNYGNILESESFRCSLFKEAEKKFLRDNAQIGDTIFLQNVRLKCINKKVDNKWESNISLIANYADQIMIISKNNHAELYSRGVRNQHLV